MEMLDDTDLDPCEVLGLGLDAPEKDVIVAYRKASLKCHPDRCPDDPEAAEKFSRICRAKDILLDPRKRASFLAARQRAELENIRAKARQQRDAPTLKVSYHRTVTESEKSSSVQSSSPNTQEALTAAAALHGKERSFAEVKKVVEGSPASSAAVSAATPQRTPQRSFFEIRTAPASGVAKEVDPRAAEEEKERERRGIERLENAKRLVEERERRKVEEAQERQKKYQEMLESAKKEAERKENEKKEKEAADKERKEKLRLEREQKKEADRLEKERQQQEKRERQQQEKERKERERQDKAQKQKERLDNLRIERERATQETNAAELQENQAIVPVSSGTDDMPMACDLPGRNDDLSFSKPVKRKAPLACSVTYQPAKQICKRGSLAEQIRDALESTDYEVPDVTMSARQMLAAACKEVVISSSDGHHFQLQMVEMIKETLDSIQKVLDERAALTSQVVEAAAPENQRHCTELSSALENARTAFECKKLTISNRAAEQIKDKDALAELRAAEKSGAAKVDELSAKEKTCAESKAAASRAQQTFNALVENGPSSKAADTKKMLKEVETYMKMMKVEETLVWRVQQAVIPALQRKPCDRQGMDDMAITGMEGCFGTYLDENEEGLKEVAQQVVIARDRVKRVREEIETKRRKCQEDCDEQQAAKEELRTREAAVKEAERALQHHNKEVDQAASNVQRHSDAAANFRRLLQSFTEIVP